jgi:hypothetical protein
MYRLDQGILCFQNGRMFYGGRENVISFRPIRNVQLSTAPICIKVTKVPRRYVQISYTEFQRNRTTNVDMRMEIR